MKKVLVTGANGHLGYNLTRLLKDRGYEVRASVRDLNDPQKTHHLRALGVDIVAADVMRPQTLRAAMAGVDGVFQVAAVYDITAKHPEKDVQEPSIVGGINVLKAAHEAGVKKVIFTSSTTAVGNDINDGQPLTEADWNTGAIEPYAQGKMLAEKKAWEFARAHGLNMVSVLPSAMIGPGFYRHTPTTQSFEQLLLGKVPFALPLSFSFVDVRDSAKAHVLAYENERAAGRYIVSSHYCSLMELFETIKHASPNTKIPGSTLPASMLPMVPFLDWLGNKLSKTPRFATAKFIEEYANKRAIFSSKKIGADLNWRAEYEFSTSVADTVRWVRDIVLDQRKSA